MSASGQLRWHRVKEIFSLASETPAEERAAMVDRLCEGDSELRREVDELLALRDEDNLALDRPAPIERPSFGLPSRYQAGDLLAHRYRITAFIASGGMGEVYAAEDVEMGRPVALKCIRNFADLDGHAEARLVREVRMAGAMKIHDNIQQQSLDWQILRSGKVTASEMDNLVTPLGKVKTGEGPKTYLMNKVAEAWRGGPLPTVEVWNMEQGQYLEEIARPAFTLETGLDVRQVAFITGDDERVGCSPDGLIGDDCGLEIKCPHIQTHIRYLLDGVLPPDYVLQVQGSLFVTGFKKWMFFSFRRDLPPLILTVEPDEKIQKAIGEAVTAFLDNYEKALAKLTELNGGVRPKPKFALSKPVVPPVQREDETFDTIP